MSTMLLDCPAGVRSEGGASSRQGGWPQQPEPTKPRAASQPTTLLPGAASSLAGISPPPPMAQHRVGS